MSPKPRLRLVDAESRVASQAGDRSRTWDRHHWILTGFLLRTGHEADETAHAYAGINANVLCSALEAIQGIDRFSFVGLGAGKGRAVAVASAFPFRAIVGIELNPKLCRVATRNAMIIAAAGAFGARGNPLGRAPEPFAGLSRGSAAASAIARCAATEGGNAVTVQADGDLARRFSGRELPEDAANGRGFVGMDFAVVRQGPGRSPIRRPRNWPVVRRPCSV